MNYFSKKGNTVKSTLVLFRFIVLLNVPVFGQVVEKELNMPTNMEVLSEAKEESSSSSDMNFVLWFMGSKQDPNSTISTEGINTKKRIMTSGLAPNRLLIKTFLKKAVNFENALA
jgi:hypothetical protein